MRNGVRYRLNFRRLRQGCCLRLLEHLASVSGARQSDLAKKSYSTHDVKYLKVVELYAGRDRTQILASGTNKGLSILEDIDALKRAYSPEAER